MKKQNLVNLAGGIAFAVVSVLPNYAIAGDVAGKTVKVRDYTCSQEMYNKLLKKNFKTDENGVPMRHNTELKMYEEILSCDINEDEKIDSMEEELWTNAQEKLNKK